MSSYSGPPVSPGHPCSDPQALLSLASPDLTPRALCTVLPPPVPFPGTLHPAQGLSTRCPLALHIPAPAGHWPEQPGSCPHGHFLILQGTRIHPATSVSSNPQVGWTRLLKDLPPPPAPRLGSLDLILQLVSVSHCGGCRSKVDYGRGPGRPVVLLSSVPLLSWARRPYRYAGKDPHWGSVGSICHCPLAELDVDAAGRRQPRAPQPFTQP